VFSILRKKRRLTRRPSISPPQLAAITHNGRLRSHNEDSFLVMQLPGQQDILMAVADGVGGETAGEVASYIALRNLLRERLKQSQASIETRAGARQLLTDGLYRANWELASINARFLGEHFCMGTTVVAAVVTGLQAVIAHAGDSRCYLWRSGHFWQITRDHTCMQELMEEGLLNSSEIAEHPLRHALSNCLGVLPQTQLSFTDVECQPQDRMLLCSDGVSNMLSRPEMAACVGTAATAAEAVEAIIREGLRRGGGDNLTAVAAFV
jgi:protein phosphatase